MLFCTYEILINLHRDKTFHKTAELINDPYVFTYRGSIETVDMIPDMVGFAWNALTRHNRDDRPDGQIGPSFSIGDAVVVIDREGKRTTFVDCDGQFHKVNELANVERVKQWRQCEYVVTALVLRSHKDPVTPTPSALTHAAVPTETLERFATELSDVVQLLVPVVAPAVKDRIESVSLRLAPRHFRAIPNPDA